MPYQNKESQRRYYKAYNRKRRATQKKVARTWYLDNRERAIESAERSRVRRKFGLSLEAYRAKKRKTRRCAVCLKPFGKSKGLRPALDHNHKTKKLRAFIHGTCNRAIGYLKEDPKILRRAAAYLERYDSD